jgi:serine/threonine-protein kinase
MLGHDCVSDEDLRAFLHGDLTERLAAPIARHLDDCASCEATARRLETEADALVRSLRLMFDQPLVGDAAPTLSESSQHRTPDHHAAPGPSASGMLPDRVAGYEILGELGRGGMSVVYQAQQAQPARMVALKMILAGGHADPERRTRFLAEADAIARLQHPHIVQVFEVGEHDGLPFLSLEYVPGGSLARKLHEGPLAPQLAAALVEQLARAVQYAHERAVIHRDLKPGNVLLTEDGAPKVTDFGLAKAERPELTATGAVLGTPSYMAPEQAKGDNRAVGPLADVYALGAVLYECLTGRPPFQAPTPLDVLAQVVSQEPVPPRQLQPKLPRDLETVCLKCLRKEPTRRYGSAAELADDLGRFLDGEPIRARPVGRAERLARWIKRHPTWAALLASSLLVVVLGTVSLFVFQQLQNEQARQADRADYLRDEVDAALTEAEGVRGELHKTLGHPLKVHRLLTHPEQWWAPLKVARAAWERAQKLAEADREFLAEDLNVRLQKVQALLESDERDYQLAMKLDALLLKAGPPVEGVNNRAAVAHEYEAVLAAAGLDIRRGDLAQTAARISRSPCRYVLVAALDHWAHISREDAVLMPRLVQVARQVDPDPWRDQFRQATVRKDRKKLEELVRQVKVAEQPPQFLENVGLTLHYSGGYSRPLLKAALIQYPGDLWLNIGQAQLCYRDGDAVGMVEHFRAALALRPDSAMAHLLLSEALFVKKDLDGALQQARRALQLDPKLANVHRALGQILYARKDLDGAIAHYQKALHLAPDLAYVHLALGSALLDRKDVDGAIRHYTRSLQLDPTVASVHYNLSIALTATKDSDGALRHLRKAVELDPKFVAAHINLGIALHNNKDLEGAFRHLTRALELDPTDAAAHHNLARLLAHVKDRDGAVQHLTKAVKLDPNNAEHHYNLGLVLYQKKDLVSATPHLTRAIDIDPNHAQAHYIIGWVYVEQGKFADSVREFRRADELGYRQLGWKYAPAKCVANSEKLVDLDKQLTAILAGQAPPPVGVREQVAAADMCRRYKKCHAAAARIYAGARAAAPQPAPDFIRAQRYPAACSAVLAGAGQGNDAANLAPEERAKLRRQARAWLREELDWLTSQLLRNQDQGGTGAGLGGLQEKLAQPSGPTAVGWIVHVLDQLSRWQADPELASVRENQELARLAPQEQDDWRTFWADVAALEKRGASLFAVTNLSGTLTELRREQAHEVPMDVGKTYVVDLRSERFYTVLRLENFAGKKLAESDPKEDPTGKSARRICTANQTGTYRFIATSFGRWGRGEYSLQVREFTGAR